VVLGRRLEVVDHIIGALNVDDWAHARHVLPLPQVAHAHLRMRLVLRLLSLALSAWIDRSDLRLGRVLLEDAELLVLRLRWIQVLLLQVAAAILLEHTRR